MKCYLIKGRNGCCFFTIKALLLFFFLTSFIFLTLQLYHYAKINPDLLQQRLKPNEMVLEPQIDGNVNFSEASMIEEIQGRFPNLPIEFWNEKKSEKGMGFNSTCAPFPDLLNLEFNNLYWQTLRSANGTFQLFGAYLDVRKNNLLGPTIRILGMLDRIEPTVATHCQIWFENQNQPIIVRTLEYKYIWYRKWGNYKQGINQPYLLACKVPPEHWDGSAPIAVSLVEAPCSAATNFLKVFYNTPPPLEEKKNFAVCVKGLDFPHRDLSVKLTEWIELLHLLGADKIFFYELGVHPNVSKVLRYYEKQDKVHVTPLTLAGAQPNGPSLQHFFLTKKIIHKRQNELIPYNDCFYKHMYEYKFIVLLDTDEVIMPLEGSSWKELLDLVISKAKRAKNIERASFNVRNVYFLDDLLHNHGWFENIPHYMHMLQHVYRAKNFTKPGAYIKSFFNTEKVLTLHNHYPLGCLGNCFSYSIETNEAQLQHYRSDCVNELKKTCENFRNSSVMDTTIWKFKKPLIQRVVDTLKTLGFFVKDKR